MQQCNFNFNLDCASLWGRRACLGSSSSNTLRRRRSSIRLFLKKQNTENLQQHGSSSCPKMSPHVRRCVHCCNNMLFDTTICVVRRVSSDNNNDKVASFALLSTNAAAATGGGRRRGWRRGSDWALAAAAAVQRPWEQIQLLPAPAATYLPSCSSSSNSAAPHCVAATINCSILWQRCLLRLQHFWFVLGSLWAFG